MNGLHGKPNREKTIVSNLERDIRNARPDTLRGIFAEMICFLFACINDCVLKWIAQEKKIWEFFFFKFYFQATEIHSSKKDGIVHLHNILKSKWSWINLQNENHLFISVNQSFCNSFVYNIQKKLNVQVCFC